MNRHIVIGRLGQDPEVRYFESGSCVVKFSMAYDEYKGKDKDSVTHWLNFEAWGKTAEVVANYCKKGSQLAVEGEVITSTYEKDGATRKNVFTKVSKVHLLGSNSSLPPSNSYDF